MKKTAPKPFVFVLIPFKEEFDDVYELGIKEASHKVGAYCERVNEQMFEGSILERIYNQISKADIVVADMTGKNPNVFYETGYAHALGKHVILLTQDSNDIPFDLQHYQIIVYGGKIKKLKADLCKRLQWAIKNPKESVSSIKPKIQYFVKGTQIVDGGEIITDGYKKNMRKSEYNYTFRSELQLDIFNPTERVVDCSNINLALIIPNVASSKSTPPIKLPDGRYMLLIPKFGELYPGAWTYTRVSFEIFKGRDDIDFLEEGLEVVLREITEIGSRDIKVIIKIKSIYV